MGITNDENERAFTSFVSSLKDQSVQILAEFTIVGEPASKANSRRVAVNKKTGRMLFIKSAKANIFADAARQQSPMVFPMPEYSVGAAILIHYASRRPDLDESIILDAMQGRCFKNDRCVERKFVVRGSESKEPRAIVVIYKL